MQRSSATRVYCQGPLILTGAGHFLEVLTNYLVASRIHSHFASHGSTIQYYLIFSHKLISHVRHVDIQVSSEMLECKPRESCCLLWRRWYANKDGMRKQKGPIKHASQVPTSRSASIVLLLSPCQHYTKAIALLKQRLGRKTLWVFVLHLI
jgi:hypothetical protein